MHAPTRCYPAGDLTPLLCTVRNAQSPIPEIGPIAIRQLIEQLRPHVQHYVARLVAGLRRPSLSVDLHVEHALVSVGASLAVCTADTDSAFYAWVSAITTASVLEQHMYDAAHQLQRRRRALRSRRLDKGPDTDTGRGHAA